jgi:hypothetical protein
MQEKNRAVGAFTVGIIAGTILGTGIGLLSAFASGWVTAAREVRAGESDGFVCKTMEYESEEYPGDNVFFLSVRDSTTDEVVIRGFNSPESDGRSFSLTVLPDTTTELHFFRRDSETFLTIGDMDEGELRVIKLQSDSEDPERFVSSGWCYRKSMDDESTCYSDINGDGLLDAHWIGRKLSILVQDRWMEVDSDDAHEKKPQALRRATLRAADGGVAYTFDNVSGRWEVAE